MSAKILFAAMTTAAAASICSGAQAASLPAGVQMLSTTVRVGDLNLASRSDAQVALTRIRFAAERVCGHAADLRDLGAVAARQHCLSVTVERAVTELSSPTVTAVYDDGHGAPRTYAANDRR